METGNFETHSSGAFSEITEQHGMLLNKLRENFDTFLQYVESEFRDASDKVERF
jgi:hypothetical protein